MSLKKLKKFKHIYFTSIEKQILTTYTNLSRFCFLEITPVIAPNVSANEKSHSLRPAPWARTPNLMIARPMLYFTTKDTTSNVFFFEVVINQECVV